MKLLSKTLLSCSLLCICSNPYISFAKNYDINKDGIINTLDLDTLSTYFESYDENYDLNDDGVIDALDLATLAKQITTHEEGNKVIIAYNNEGTPLGSFTEHNLLDAISLASKNNGVVKHNNAVIWNNEKYFVYSRDESNITCDSMREALSKAYSLNNSIVTSKNGNIIYNKNLNFRKIMGVTNTSVNLRSAPKMSARTDIMIPDGTLVEVSNIEKGFYKVSYYNEKNKVFTGYVPGYLDIIQDDIDNTQLGYISAREESNGNPGIVAQNPNDKGGASFGVWQLSSKMGSVDEFLKFISNKDEVIFKKLTEAKDKDNGNFSDNFIAEWKNVANQFYDKFYELQRLFIKQNYYDALIKIAKKNNMNLDSFLNYSSTSNMMWSTAVQHGAGGAVNILKKIPLDSPIETIISNVYDERLKIIAKSYPPNSPNPGVVALYNGIKTRLENEKAEILRIYKRELHY